MARAENGSGLVSCRRQLLRIDLDDAQNRSNLLNLKIDVVYLVVLYQHQYQLFQALRTNTIASASLLPGVPLC